VVGAYGRKLLDNLRAGTPKHLYLPGPHRGVFNAGGIEGEREIILCEALLDALTFWMPVVGLARCADRGNCRPGRRISIHLVRLAALRRSN
jgi:hypothetical protein